MLGITALDQYVFILIALQQASLIVCEASFCMPSSFFGNVLEGKKLYFDEKIVQDPIFIL